GRPGGPAPRAPPGGREALPADAVPRAAPRHGRGIVKLRELKDLSLDELKTRERELVDEVFHLRLKRATAHLPTPMKMRETRRTLARVKTLLGERTASGAARGGSR